MSTIRAVVTNGNDSFVDDDVSFGALVTMLIDAEAASRGWKI